MEIPTGHQPVMPYLMVNDAQKFITFMENVFNAALTFKRMREDNTTVMHAEIQISGSTIMFCEATEQWKKQPANLFVYVDNADETYKTAIDNGATTLMELADQNYGRACGVTDPFGNIWWITSVQ
ncbi:VOC family protein [Chitinophaga sp. MM2321]|uniref:VOC family protein n=1 Tax=Chitinophaga sp. MM2321 TaxID=3137178 RepID=UPI0032D5A1C6